MQFLTKSGGSWELPQEQLHRWADVYKGIAVERECLKASVWLEANPGRRKTANGMLRFLVNWLNRARSFKLADATPRPNRASTAGAYAPHVCPHEPPCPEGTTRVQCQQREILGLERWRELYPDLAEKL